MNQNYTKFKIYVKCQAVFMITINFLHDDKFNTHKNWNFRIARKSYEIEFRKNTFSFEYPFSSFFLSSFRV